MGFLTKPVRAVGILLLVGLIAGCGSHVYHKVKRGETLYAVSFHYGQDFREVAKWNNVRAPYTIYPGQWLRVAPPASGSKRTQSASVSTAPTQQPSSPSAAAQKPAPTSKPIPKSTRAQVAKTAPTPSKSPKPTQPVSVKRAPIQWHWPAKGSVLQTYSATTQGKRGINIGGYLGNPVNAAASGRVVYSGSGLRGYGNLIIIKHDEKYLSAYAHNQKILVKEGDQVKAGQVIARMGQTEADRVMLHFEIRVDGRPVDPMRYLPKRGS